MIDSIVGYLLDFFIKQGNIVCALLVLVIVLLLYVIVKMDKTIKHKDELLRACYDDVKNNSISLLDLCDKLQTIIMVKK